MKKFSSRYSIAVHILSLVALSPTSCTSDFIAESVNTNPVIIRRIIGMLKKAGLVHVRAGAGGPIYQRDLMRLLYLMCIEQLKLQTMVIFLVFMMKPIQSAQ